MYSVGIVQRGKVLDLEYLGLQLKFIDNRFNHLQNGYINSWLENGTANETEYMKAICKLQNATHLILNLMTCYSLKNTCKDSPWSTHKLLKVPFKILSDNFFMAQRLGEAPSSVAICSVLFQLLSLQKQHLGQQPERLPSGTYDILKALLTGSKLLPWILTLTGKHKLHFASTLTYCKLRPGVHMESGLSLTFTLGLSNTDWQPATFYRKWKSALSFSLPTCELYIIQALEIFQWINSCWSIKYTCLLTLCSLAMPARALTSFQNHNN